MGFWRENRSIDRSFFFSFTTTCKIRIFNQFYFDQISHLVNLGLVSRKCINLLVPKRYSFVVSFSFKTLDISGFEIPASIRKRNRMIWVPLLEFF